MNRNRTRSDYIPRVQADIEGGRRRRRKVGERREVDRGWIEGGETNLWQFMPEHVNLVQEKDD